MTFVAVDMQNFLAHLFLEYLRDVKITNQNFFLKLYFFKGTIHKFS